jgi:uncharacterized membrane protein
MDFGGWIKEAFQLYKENFVLLFVASLLALLLGVFTCGILYGPMLAGVTLILLRLLRNAPQKPNVGDVFIGFEYFLPAFLFCLVWGVVSSLLSYLAPGIGAVAAWCVSPLVMFTISLIVDRKMDFGPAMVQSYNMAKTQYGPLLLLCLVSISLFVVGALVCGIGVFFTAPLMLAIPVVAYHHLSPSLEERQAVEEKSRIEAEEPPPEA